MTSNAPAPLHCDVLILGGGPAGCSAALRLLDLQPDLKVVLAEQETGPVPRPGEALHGQALPLLRQLGIQAAFLEQNYLQSQGMRAYWGSPVAHERHQLLDYSGGGWQVDRYRFHAFLRDSVAQRGGTVLQGRFMGQSRWAGDHWQIQLVQNQASTQVNCRLVLDATGRKAVFARHCGAQIEHTDRLCGVQCFFTLDNAHPMDHFVQVEAVPNGWWYSAPLPDQRCAVTYFSDSDLIRERQLHVPAHWLGELAQAPNTLSRIRHAQPEGPPVIFNAMSQRLSTAAGEGWLAVGDAACAFDPLSGQGMFKALRSGIWAAYAAVDLLVGKTTALDKYNYIVQTEFEAYRTAYQANYATEERWRDHAFWQRRAA